MTDSKPIAIVPAVDFLKLCAMSSNEETRFYLCGVLIEPIATGAVGVAMDGYILGALRWGSSEATATAPLILSNSKVIQRAAKAGKRDNFTLVCYPDRMDVVNHYDRLVGDGLVTQSFPAKVAYVDATFPAWRKVLPDAGKPENAGRSHTPHGRDAANWYHINPEFLARFAVFGGFVSFDWSNGPIGVTVSGAGNFYGVVMPANGGASPNEIADRRAWIAAGTAPVAVPAAA